MDSQVSPKKKSIFKRWWFWLIVVIVIFIIIGSSNSTPVKVGSAGSTATGTPAAITQSTTFKVGDQIKIGDSYITVNKVDVTHGGEFSQPSSGNEFVSLNITIQNTSNTSQYVTTLGQMFVKDAGGNSYQVTSTDVTMQNISEDLDGTVIANSKRTGWVGFEVPAKDTGLQFQYLASEFGGNTISVDLGQ
jgi:hypothetical protein